MSKNKIERINSEAVLSEFIGTFILAAAILVALSSHSLSPIIRLIIASATLLFVTLILAPYSGAHVNPAVTLSHWVMKKIGNINAIAFIVAQFSAALLAMVAISLFNSGIVYEVNSVSDWSSFWAEFLGAFVLGIGYAAIFVHPFSNLEKALVVSMAFFVGLIIAGAGGAAFINPAVAVSAQASALSYATAPFFGAAFGTVVFHMLQPHTAEALLSQKKSKSKKK